MGEEDRDRKYSEGAGFAAEDPYPVGKSAFRVGSMRTKHAVKKLAEQGKTQLEIAEALNLSLSSVAVVMQRYKIKRVVGGASRG